MASDDDDDLVKFLESEVLSDSDQEGEINDERIIVDVDYDSEDEVRKEEEENVEAEENEINKMLVEEGCISCENQEKDEGDERVTKRRRVEGVENERPFTLIACKTLPSVELEAASLSSKKAETAVVKGSDASSSEKGPVPNIIKPGSLGKVPPELFRGILKYLSSEDLVSCSLACRFLNLAASDESLWRRLYSLRWGPLPPETMRESAWKKLYIQRDEKDTKELLFNCAPEFKEYYKQMQTAKRSQAPLPSQVIDDLVILDKTLTDQISTWKRSRGLTDNVVANHVCSGVTCTYFHIGDAMICEKTGNVHVCDDNCKETVNDRDECMVCTISGRCFDMNISSMAIDQEEQPGATDYTVDEAEAEEVLGDKARRAQLYQLGYDCEDERELEALKYGSRSFS